MSLQHHKKNIFVKINQPSKRIGGKNELIKNGAKMREI